MEGGKRRLGRLTTVLVVAALLSASSVVAAGALVNVPGVLEVGTYDRSKSEVDDRGASNTGPGYQSSVDDPPPQCWLPNPFGGDCLFAFDENSTEESNHARNATWYYYDLEDDDRSGAYANLKDGLFFMRVQGGPYEHVFRNGSSVNETDFEHSTYDTNIGYSEDHLDSHGYVSNYSKEQEDRLSELEADASLDAPGVGGGTLSADREQGSREYENHEYDREQNRKKDEYFGIPLIETGDRSLHDLDEEERAFWNTTLVQGTVFLVNPLTNTQTEIVGLRLDKGESDQSSSFSSTDEEGSYTRIFGFSLIENQESEEQRSRYALFRQWLQVIVDVQNGTVTGDLSYDRGQESSYEYEYESQDVDVVGIPLFGTKKAAEDQASREWRRASFTLSAGEGLGEASVEHWNEDSAEHHTFENTFSLLGIPFGIEGEEDSRFHSDGLSVAAEVGGGLLYITADYLNETSHEEKNTDLIVGAPLVGFGSEEDRSTRSVGAAAGTQGTEGVGAGEVGASYSKEQEHKENNLRIAGEDFLGLEQDSRRTAYDAHANAPSGIFAFGFEYVTGSDSAAINIAGFPIGIGHDYREFRVSNSGNTDPVTDPATSAAGAPDQTVLVYSFDHEETDDTYRLFAGDTDILGFRYRQSQDSLNLLAVNGLVDAEAERSWSDGQLEAAEFEIFDFTIQTTEAEAKAGPSQSVSTVPVDAGGEHVDPITVGRGEVSFFAFFGYLEFVDALALGILFATWCVDPGTNAHEVLTDEIFEFAGETDVPDPGGLPVDVGTVNSVKSVGVSVGKVALAIALLAACGLPVVGLLPFFLLSPCILVPIAHFLVFDVAGPIVLSLAGALVPAALDQLLDDPLDDIATLVAHEGIDAAGDGHDLVEDTSWDLYDEYVGCMWMVLPNDVRNPQPGLEAMTVFESGPSDDKVEDAPIVGRVWEEHVDDTSDFFFQLIAENWPKIDDVWPHYDEARYTAYDLLDDFFGADHAAPNPLDALGVAPDPCSDPDDPMCAQPASPGCTAFALRVRVPRAGIDETYAVSQAHATSGTAHDDNVSEDRVIGDVLRARALESSCDAATEPVEVACGEARLAELFVNLTSLGLPATVRADVLHDVGCSESAAVGAGGATLANVTVTLGDTVIRHPSSAPNTAVFLGPLGFVAFNEQHARPSGTCTHRTADALRLLVPDPENASAYAAEVVVGWVSTVACKEPSAATAVATPRVPTGGVAPGTPANATATVAGAGGSAPVPTGYVRFLVCEGAFTGCPAGGRPAGAGRLDAAGVATSPDFTDTMKVSSWCWRAEYLGDGYYLPSSYTDGSGMCFQTLKQPVALGAVADPPDAATPGDLVRAIGVARGGEGQPAPTGTVAFFLCPPHPDNDDVGCAAPRGSAVGAPGLVNLTGNATSQQTDQTQAAGLFCWRAEYGGDAFYLPATGTDNATACFSTEKQPALLGTTATPTGAGVVPGTPATDEVAVRGLPGQPVPTGTVRFYLCAPAEATPRVGCQAPNGTLVGSPATLDFVGNATSAAAASTMAIGTYCWRVEYLGDGFFLPAVHTDFAGECFTTARQVPILGTTSSRTGGGHAPGSSVTDAVTLTGLVGKPVPTGNVRFFLCAPHEQNSVVGCTVPRGVQIGALRALSAGTATSDPAGGADTRSLGTFCWRVLYEGDAFYLPATHTNTGSECFATARQAPVIATLSNPTGVGAAPGQNATDTVTITGAGPTPTGLVQFFICRPVEGAEPGAALRDLEVTAAGCPPAARARSTGSAGGLGGEPIAAATPIGTEDVNGYTWLSLNLSGGWVATVAFEGRNGSAAWVPVALRPIGEGGNPGPRNNTTLPGVFEGHVVHQQFRARITQHTSGTVDAALDLLRLGGIQVGNATELLVGIATSQNFTANVTIATFCWRVAYGGDDFYLPANHTNRASECFTTSKQLPLTDLQSSPDNEPGAPDYQPVVRGSKASASLTFTPRPNMPPPNGTIEFWLCVPGESAASGCPSGAGTMIGSAVALDNGQADSVQVGGTTTMPIGDYCWRIVYAGDHLHLPIEYTNGGTACFRVEMKLPEVDSNSAPGGSLAQDAQVRDQVTVFGGAEALDLKPTGTIQFWLCAPFEITLGQGCLSPGGTEVGDPRGLDGDGRAESEAARATRFGDELGYGLAISSTRLLVGAPGEEHLTGDPPQVEANNTGAAYLFNVANGRLLQRFENPDPDEDDRFGESVALVGTTHVLVGAPYDDNDGTDAGRAYLFDTSGNLVATLTNNTVGAGDKLGSAVAAIDLDHLWAGAPGDDGSGSDAGIAMVFNRTGDFQFSVQNPNASNASAGDNFGWALAVVGSNVAVGVPGDDLPNATEVNFPSAGSVFVYSGATGGFAAQLVPPDLNADDHFGSSLAAVGNNLAVGAPGNDTGASNAGAAFLMDASTGALVQALLNPAPAANDDFGRSVGASGSNVLVGAPQDDATGPNHGAGYLFDGSTGSLLRTFTNTSLTGGSKFGHAVAGTGSAAFLGAPFFDTGSRSGGVWQFSPSTGALVRVFSNFVKGMYCWRADYSGDVRYLAVQHTNFGSECFTVDRSPAKLPIQFSVSASVFEASGGAVSVRADIDEVFEENGPAATGTMTFYLCDPVNVTAGLGCVAPAGAWVGDAAFNGTALGPSNTTYPSELGRWCWRGEYGGDGFYLANVSTNFGAACFFSKYGTVLTGSSVPGGAAGDVAPGATVRGEAGVATVNAVVPTGSVQFFLCREHEIDSAGCPGPNGTMVGETKTLDGAGQATSDAVPGFGDGLGGAVAVVGTDFAVGAPAADVIVGMVTHAGAGKVYLFEGATGRLKATLVSPDPAAGDAFGASVAAVGANLLVGEPGNDTSGLLDAGSAHVLTPAGAHVVRLEAPTPAVNASFGWAVAAVDGKAGVGAPGNASGDIAASTTPGTVHVFDPGTGSLVRTYTTPSADNGDGFGLALATAGSDLLVGAPFDDTGAADAGQAYVLDGASDAVDRTLANPSAQAGDRFGAAVASAGLLAIFVGAPGDDTNATDAGIAYRYGAGASPAQTYYDPDATPGDAFGAALAAFQGGVAIGSPLRDAGVADNGAAFVFNATGDLNLTLVNPAHLGGASFGAALGALGGLIAVGAPFHDDHVTDTGAVHVFDGAVDLAADEGGGPNDNTTGEGDRDLKTLVRTLGNLGVGKYCWRAEYLGDANYVRKNDTDDFGQCFTVKLPVTITTLSDPQGGGITPGRAVTDTVVVGGVAGYFPPNGTVSWSLCGPGMANPVVVGVGCPAGGTSKGSKALSATTSTNTSDPATDTLLVGTYCWRVSYPGNDLYLAGTHTNFDTECFTTVKKPAAVSASSSAHGADILPWTLVSDTATVTGDGPVPTGDVNFYLCGPTEVTDEGCPAGGTLVGTRPLVDGVATSPGTQPLAVGIFCWRAEYLGDNVYLGASYTDNTMSCFVTEAQPSATSALATPTGPGAAPWVNARDAATVTVQGPPATGSVLFYLCEPADVTPDVGCEAPNGTLVGAGLLAGGAANSPPASALHGLGVLCWRAEYPGDLLYLPSSATNNGTQCFETEPQALTLTSAAQVPAGDVGPDAVVRDLATLVPPPDPDGPPVPTGEVVFYLCSPLEATPLGCPSPNGTEVGDPIVVDGAGEALSDPAPTLLDVGTSCWRADYSGDDIYLPALHTDAAAECFTVVQTCPHGAGDALGSSMAPVGTNLLVGLPGDDGSATDAGAACLLSGVDGSLVYALVDPTPDRAPLFGSSVLALGGLVAAGVPNHDEGATDTGAVVLVDGGTGATVRTIPNPSPEPLDRFGASLAALGGNLAVGAPFDDTGGVDAGAVYVFEPGGTLVRTIVAPSPKPGDRFGAALATLGSDLVVGAPGNDSGALNAGAAFLVDGASPSIVPILNPDPDPHDQFGAAVAAVGGEVLVGAPFDDGGARNAGAAYLFGPGGTLRLALPNPEPSSGDKFGSAVAGAGGDALVGAPGDDAAAPNGGRAYQLDASDGSLVRFLDDPAPLAGDGFGAVLAAGAGSILVGAPADDSGAPDAGRSFAFDASTGALLATFGASAAAGDRFGSALAAMGTSVLAGAPGRDAAGEDAGAVLVLDAATGAVLRTVDNPAPDAGDGFGSAVAASSGLVAVGAPGANAGGLDSGEVYVYDAATGALALTIPNPSPGAGDRFGSALAILGGDIVVGAPHDDASATDDGTVYRFDGATGLLVDTYPNPGPGDGDLFGFSLAVRGADLLVGAPYDDTGGVDAGAAYLLDGDGGGLLLSANLWRAGEHVGWSVAALGEHLLVGAPDADGEVKTEFRHAVPGTSAEVAGSQTVQRVPRAGAAYLFNGTQGEEGLDGSDPAQPEGSGDHGNGTVEETPFVGGMASAGTTLLATFPNPSPATGDRFGWSVGAVGGSVLIGEPGNLVAGEAGAGSAWLSEVPMPASSDPVSLNGSLGAVANASRYLELRKASPAAGDDFGAAVAAFGADLLVAAPQDDNAGAGSGRVYRFDGAGAVVGTFGGGS